MAFPLDQRTLQDAVASYNRLIEPAQTQALKIYTAIRVFLEEALDVSVPYKKIGQYVEFPVVVNEESATAIEQGDDYVFSQLNGNKAVTKVVEYANPKILTKDVLDMLKEAKTTTDFENVWNSNDELVRGTMQGIIAKLQADIFNITSKNTDKSVNSFFSAFNTTPFLNLDPADATYWKANMKTVNITGTLTDVTAPRGTETKIMKVLNDMKKEAKTNGGIMNLFFVTPDVFDALRSSLSIAGTNKVYNDMIDLLEFDGTKVVEVSKWTGTQIYGLCKGQFKVAINNDDLLIKEDTLHQDFNKHKTTKFTPSIALQWYPLRRDLCFVWTIAVTPDPHGALLNVSPADAIQDTVLVTDAMTVEELKQFATDNNINLTETRKDAIIDEINKILAER